MLCSISKHFTYSKNTKYSTKNIHFWHFFEARDIFDDIWYSRYYEIYVDKHTNKYGTHFHHGLPAQLWLQSFRLKFDQRKIEGG